MELIFGRQTTIDPTEEKIDVIPEKIDIVTFAELLNERDINDVISFYGVVVRVGNYQQKISKLGNPYSLRVVAMIDDSYDGELVVTLWGEHGFNELKINQLVFVKNAKIDSGHLGDKKVSVSKDSTITTDNIDKRIKELATWIQDQLNFQDGIDTPQLNTVVTKKEQKQEDEPKEKDETKQEDKNQQKDEIKQKDETKQEDKNKTSNI